MNSVIYPEMNISLVALKNFDFFYSYIHKFLGETDVDKLRLKAFIPLKLIGLFNFTVNGKQKVIT